MLFVLAASGTCQSEDVSSAPPASWSSAGCGGHAGPVVVVALDALPSDLWRSEAWRDVAPALTGLALEPTSWVGTGVASSSASLPAVVSLWTGLEVRRHGLVGGGLEGDSEPAPGVARSRRRSSEILGQGVTSLAEALADCGYDSTAEWGPSGRPAFPLGLAQGVNEVSRSGRDRVRLLESLEALEAENSRLFWVHIDRAEPPWLPSNLFLERLGGEAVPAAVRWGDLQALGDASAQRRQEIARAYSLAVAAADHRFGLLLERLARSPAWNETVLVVTGTASADIGRDGSVGYSTGLTPRELTVPLLLRLPAALRESIPTQENVGPAQGLFGFLVELVGAVPPPAAVASFPQASSDRSRESSRALAIESELPLDRTWRRVSLVEGDLQLVATWSRAGEESQLLEPRLVRWSAELETATVSDPDRMAAMADRLHERLMLDAIAPRASGEPCEAPAWNWSAEDAAGCKPVPSAPETRK